MDIVSLHIGRGGIVIPHEQEHARLIKLQALAPGFDLRAEAEKVVAADSVALVTKLYTLAFNIDATIRVFSGTLHQADSTKVMSRPFSVWYYTGAGWSLQTGPLPIRFKP